MNNFPMNSKEIACGDFFYVNRMNQVFTQKRSHGRNINDN